MEILKFPDPILFVNCKPVTVFGQQIKVLLDAMWETMSEARGMGLAANQVGLDFRMFVMQGPNGERIDLINPRIESHSAVPALLKEGCLSAPGEFLIIPERASWVQVSYQDSEGNSHLRLFKGLHAVCAQHEIEHLEGRAYLQSSSIPKSIRRDLTRKWGIK